MSDRDLREMVGSVPVPAFPEPAWTVPPPLDAARVAIVTTAGLHNAAQEGWSRDDPSFRVLDVDEQDVQFHHVSMNLDRSGAAADINVVYPLDRLLELEERGAIGSVARRHLSFMGAQHDTLETLRIDTAPRAAAVLLEDEVDVVVLTPVCPLCTRTAGTIAHVMETAGLATVSLSLVREQVRRLAPPRALHCDFPFGRPLGVPNDPAFQHRVLERALALLRHQRGPVLEDFPETIELDDDDVLACTLPPAVDDDPVPAVSEARGLRSAYERHLRRTGRTGVGRVTDADGIPELVARLDQARLGTTDPGLDGVLYDAVLDVNAYYEEAASELAGVGQDPSPRAAQRWIYRTTEIGRLLHDLQASMRRAGLPAASWQHVVPRGEASTHG